MVKLCIKYTESHKPFKIVVNEKMCIKIKVIIVILIICIYEDSTNFSYYLSISILYPSQTNLENCCKEQLTLLLVPEPKTCTYI